MTRHLMALPLALAAALALSACGTLTPPPARADVPQASASAVPAAWPAALAGTAGSSGPVTDAAPAPELPWSHFILDERLRRVVQQALDGNRSLRKTVQDVAAARAQYGQQDAARRPTVGGSLGSTNARSRSGDTTVTSHAASAGVSVSAWEVDLFGRVGALSDAALQTWQASAEGARSTRITLIASTATTWLQLAADRQRLALAQQTEASAERSVTITRKRLAAGVASRVDVRDAETVLHQARADVASATTAAAQDRHALELLAGGPVDDALLPDGLPADDAGLAQVQAGLSSAVLLRRPDVLQAEHALKSADFSVTAARADHFPKLTLTGSAGLASSALTSLLSGGASTVWSLAPAVGITLADGGAKRSALEAAQATRDGLVASYEATLQTAFQETADALARRATMTDELAADRARVEAAQDSATLSMRRYENGVDTFLAALTAQRTLYASQQTLVSARLTALGNRVTLYKVLGGGVVD